MSQADAPDCFVFVALVQYRTLNEGEEPKFGGTMRCYFLTTSRELAWMEIAGELTNCEYQVLVVEWIDPVTPDKWPHSWDQADQDAYDRAIATGDVILGETEPWAEEDWPVNRALFDEL